MEGLLGDGCNHRLSDSERRWRYGADLYGAARRAHAIHLLHMYLWRTVGTTSRRLRAGPGVTPSGHASGNYRDALTTRTPPSPLIGC